MEAGKMCTDKEESYSAQQQLNNLLSTKGPTFIHSEDSVYYGLSLAEQKILAKMRRGPGKTPKWRTEMMRKATKQDYQRLLLACTEALVEAWHNPNIRLDRVDVYVEVPWNFRSYWSENLPRPVILGYRDWSVVVQFKVDKLIGWLYTNGHSPYNAAELRKSIWAILQEQQKLELYYDIAADQSIIELYGEIISDVKEKKVARTLKGRGEFSANKTLDKGEKV